MNAPPAGPIPASPAGPAGERVAELAESGRAVTVRGPGGTGKTRLLTELAGTWRRAGVRVLDAHASTLPEGEVAVVIDDAHELGAPAADRLARLVQQAGGRVAVAFRPWPPSAPLADLLAGLGPGRHCLALGHADRAQVAGWANARPGVVATPLLIDALTEQTGGLPELVHLVLRALDGRSSPARPIRPLVGTSGSLSVPQTVTAHVRSRLAALDPDTRAVLHGVACGAPVDAEVLAGLLERSPACAGELVAAARATGYLLDSDRVVPLVRRTLLDAAPPDVLRTTRRRLLGVLLDRGEQPVELARRLAGEGVRDPLAADLLRRSGEAALATDPVLAGELLGEAAHIGAAPAGLAARRAQADALAGRLDAALRWADGALSDPGIEDRRRAAGVAAAVLARRGLLASAAELFRLAGDERSGSAAVALWGTGQPGEATAVLAAARAGGISSLVSVGERLMAEGIGRSMGSGPAAAPGSAASLSMLTRAAAVLEPVGRTALLVDTPADLAALVALHSGELAVADSVLQRAIAADLGGRPSRPRHLLLQGWGALLTGRTSRARQCMAAAADAGAADDRGEVVEPRDEVFLRGLEVGLARRGDDVPALVRAWVRAREAVVRHPVDLFTLLPLGELLVAGARLRDGERLRSHLVEATDLLARLGDPPLWAVPLHWAGAQAAIVATDVVALDSHVRGLEAAARSGPYAAALAAAGRTWGRVLAGEVEVEAVVQAAERLTEFGLGWDGSRLAAQAAARTADPRSRSVLLATARTSGDAVEAPRRAPEPAVRGSGPGTGPGSLSDREREVARLVVEGRTYKEIGRRLFISAKTVEHHVSRMRSRLDASTRSDLLDRLRAELAAGA